VAAVVLGVVVVVVVAGVVMVVAVVVVVVVVAVVVVGVVVVWLWVKPWRWHSRRPLRGPREGGPGVGSEMHRRIP